VVNWGGINERGKGDYFPQQSLPTVYSRKKFGKRRNGRGTLGQGWGWGGKTDTGKNNRTAKGKSFGGTSAKHRKSERGPKGGTRV